MRGIPVDAIQTLNIQRYMPIKHTVHRHRRSHPNSLTATRPADQPQTSAVRGEASLVGLPPLFREPSVLPEHCWFIVASCLMKEHWSS